MSLTSALEPNSSAKHHILDKAANSKNLNRNKLVKAKTSNPRVLNSQNANQLNTAAATVTNGSKSESKRDDDIKMIKNGGKTNGLSNGKGHLTTNGGHTSNGGGGGGGKSNGVQINGSSRQQHASPANLEAQFKAACDAINNLPKNGPVQPSNEMLLKFYGYYKQATQGPCQTSRPSMFKVIERAKYDAWHSVRNLTKEEAMRGYIDEIKSIIEIMPHNENVQKLIDLIGPFYEYVNDENEPPMLSKKDLEMADDGDDDQETETEEANDSARSDSTIMASFENNNSFNESYDKINPSLLNSYASLNGSCSESAYLIGQNGSSNGTSNHGLAVSNLHETSNGSMNGSKAATNGHASNGANNDDDEDDEDYCDTSDILNEQETLVQSSRLSTLELTSLIKPKAMRNGLPTSEASSQNLKSFVKPVRSGPSPAASYDLNHNVLPNALKAFSNDDHSNGPVFSYHSNNNSNSNHHTFNGNHSNHYENGYRLSASHNDAELEAILNQLGGELMNSPPALSGGSMTRNSRPSSTQSVVYGGRNLPSGSGFNQSGSGGGAGGSGGGNGGGHPTLDLLHHHDTNRQILLILIKLQQDTNNVLRRLSYLESTVVTIQNHLHMNRLETTNFDMNNQGSSAFSLLSTNPGRVDNYTSPNQLSATNHRRGSMWRHFFRNIDWRTVSIAIIWPLVIRLVFMFFRKVRLVIKLRRVRP